MWDPEKRMSPEEALAHKWIVKGFPQSGTEKSKDLENIKEPEPKESLNEEKESQIQTYYATHTTGIVVPPHSAEKEQKPKLNKSLVKEKAAVSQAVINVVGGPESKEGSKLQDKLVQLKEKLKLMTVKQPNKGIKYTVNTTRNADKPSDKKSLLLHVLSKKNSNQKEQKPKVSLKQSNIF